MVLEVFLHYRFGSHNSTAPLITNNYVLENTRKDFIISPYIYITFAFSIVGGRCHLFNWWLLQDTCSDGLLIDYQVERVDDHPHVTV